MKKTSIIALVIWTIVLAALFVPDLAYFATTHCITAPDPNQVVCGRNIALAYDPKFDYWWPNYFLRERNSFAYEVRGMGGLWAMGIILWLGMLVTLRVALWGLRRSWEHGATTTVR